MNGRNAIGYVVRKFPQLSETFIANEILELERQGMPVRVFSYRRQLEHIPHESLRLIKAPVTYLPDPLSSSRRELRTAQRELMRREPERYRRTAGYVLGHTVREGNADTWRRFLQAGCLAVHLLDSDVGHLHAHFAHGATRVAMLASMFTGIPFSFTAHARDIYSDDVNFRLLREKLDSARFAVTVSDYNHRWLVDRIGDVNGGLRTLYNGIDLTKFTPDPAVVREPDLILAVGRLVEKKGFAHLVDACAILRDRGQAFRCEIVGDGELQGELEQQIRKAGLAELVVLAGPRSQEEMVGLYRRAAIVALPCVEDGDGNRDALPTVLLEGLACGAPVVASRLTGIPEIVDEGENGLLVEPCDAVGLSEALERLLGDGALRARLGAAARAKAERRFDLTRNVALLRGFFNEAGADSPPEEQHADRVPVL